MNRNRVTELPKVENVLPTYILPVGHLSAHPKEEEYKGNLIVQTEHMGKAHFDAGDEVTFSSQVERKQSVVARNFFAAAAIRQEKRLNDTRKDGIAISANSSNGSNYFLTQLAEKNGVQLKSPIKMASSLIASKYSTKLSIGAQKGHNVARSPQKKDSTSYIPRKQLKSPLMESKLPGGLRLTQGQAKKYFGNEARIHFFERCHWIQNQRKITGTAHQDSVDQLVFDPNLTTTTLDPTGRDQHNMFDPPASEGDVGDYPFSPVRKAQTLKVATKVLIRTQTLEEGQYYTQMKLVSKPAQQTPYHIEDLQSEESSQVSATALDLGGSIEKSGDNETKDGTKRPRFTTNLKASQDQGKSAIGEKKPTKSSLLLRNASSKLLGKRGTETNESTENNPVKRKLSGKSAKHLLGVASKAVIAANRSRNSSKSRLSIELPSISKPTTPDSSESGSIGKSRRSSRFAAAGNRIRQLVNEKQKKLPPQHIVYSTRRVSSLGAVTPPESPRDTPYRPERTPVYLAPTAYQRKLFGMAPLVDLFPDSDDEKAEEKAPDSLIPAIEQTRKGSKSDEKKAETVIEKSKEEYRLRVSFLSPGKTKPTETNEQSLEKDIYSIYDKDPQSNHKLTFAKGLATGVSVEPLQLVCVDHRDQFNKKVLEQMKKNSLFKYVQKKSSYFDFHKDIGDLSDEDSVTEELELLGSLSPLTPHAVSRQPTAKGSLSIDGRNRPLSPISSRGAGMKFEKGVSSAELMTAASLGLEGGFIEGPPLSPRSQYIDSCIRKRLNPRASLILRRHFTKVLALQHHGMGDEMAILLAEAITGIPYIQALNVADNNLTDKGLVPILKSVTSITDLTDLDLSHNEMGPASAMNLANYLSQSNCTLKRLVLRRADVDDGECERFITALKENKVLTELDLSENLIGSSENLNTVMPDLVTGGEAIADLLRSPNCVLQTLKLGWNMIRLDGAIDLASSLQVNQTITSLDLSFNSLGNKGGITLGNALQDNKTLKSLYVTNNSIDSEACLTIVAGVLQNEFIEFVSFDGNPIGEEGAKALMLLPTIVGSRLKLSATNCNISIRDSKCWFDSANLLRRFELNLENPFDRAVALILLYLIACHQTFIIAHSEWYDPEERVTHNLKLTGRVVKDDGMISRLNKEQLMVLEGLRMVISASSDLEKAKELFKEIDEDGSGLLDEKEFRQLMLSIGMEATKEKVREVMAEYDLDNGGVIDMNEFLLFLNNQHKEAEGRIRDLSEMPVLAEASDTTNKRYIPPRTGKLNLTVVDGFTKKDTYRVINGADREYILKVAQDSGDLITMAQYGVQSYRVRYVEALALVESMLKENSNNVQILAKVLPQMQSAFDARVLVNKVLNNSKTDIQRLKREIGLALKPMLGCADGFYVLDLSRKMDQICLNKLLEMSMTVAHIRGSKSKLGYRVLGDCSQRGNWSCFRNELYNGNPVTVSTEFASPMPKNGRLEFDFISERRFSQDEHALSDLRFTNILIKLFQVPADERNLVLEALQKSKEETDKTLKGDANTIYECPKDRSMEIGILMEAFYENLPLRSQQNEKSRSKEHIKVTPEVDPATTRITQINAGRYYKVPSTISPLEPLIEPPAPLLSKASRRRSAMGSMTNRKSTRFSSFKGEADTTGSRGASKTPRSVNTSTALTGEVTLNPTDSSREGSRGASKTPRSALTSAGPTGDVTPIPDDASKDGSELTPVDDDDVSLPPMLSARSRQSSWISAPLPSQLPSRQPSQRFHLSSPNTNMESLDGDIPGGELNLDRLQLNLDDESENPDDQVHKAITVTFQENVEQAEKQRRGSVLLSSANDVTKQMAIIHAFQQGAVLEETLLKYVCVMASSNIVDEAKAARTVDLLVETFECHYFMARHLELLCKIFKRLGTIPTSEYFGTYRVELIVSLFSCVIDLHNFEIVMRLLTPFEAACVICRVGWLHIYNPMKPEGSYELNLSRREERVILKTLAQLATAEPGDNLPFISFRWEREMDCMPGFELTELWLTEDGVPRKGIWNGTYYAGEGKGKNGCKPFSKMRKSMLQLVLINEDEIIKDEERLAGIKPTLVGESFMMANKGIWYSYLAFDPDKMEEMNAAKAEKEKQEKKSSRRK